MAAPRSDTAARRAKRWNLTVRHALYSKAGDWYHQLKEFPGALLDDRGYVMFESESAYRQCPQLKILRDVTVRGGIKGIPGYTLAPSVAETITPYEALVFIEGARVDVVQTIIERDPAARAACLNAHGFSCAVCSFDFAERYGEIGDGFIHVHHLRPLAEGQRSVDPVADLRPLCPNCHAMIHRKNPPFSIGELKTLLYGKGA